MPRTQATGNEACVYYSPTILENAGITDTVEQLWATIAIGACHLPHPLRIPFPSRRTHLA